MLFWQLFSSYVYVDKAAETTFVQNICTYNVDEIDGYTTVLNVIRFGKTWSGNVNASQIKHFCFALILNYYITNYPI
jgi:hypothetical protein